MSTASLRMAHLQDPDVIDVIISITDMRWNAHLTFILALLCLEYRCNKQTTETEILTIGALCPEAFNVVTRSHHCTWTLYYNPRTPTSLIQQEIIRDCRRLYT